MDGGRTTERVWLRCDFFLCQGFWGRHYSSELKKASRSVKMTSYFTFYRDGSYECMNCSPVEEDRLRLRFPGDDRSLQELTGSVCAPAAHRCQLKPSHWAAGSEGPTQTRGPSECFSRLMLGFLYLIPFLFSF